MSFNSAWKKVRELLGLPEPDKTESEPEQGQVVAQMEMKASFACNHGVDKEAAEQAIGRLIAQVKSDFETGKYLTVEDAMGSLLGREITLPDGSKLTCIESGRVTPEGNVPYQKRTVH